jgi:hypothetical protein
LASLPSPHYTNTNQINAGDFGLVDFYKTGNTTYDNSVPIQAAIDYVMTLSNVSPIQQEVLIPNGVFYTRAPIFLDQTAANGGARAAQTTCTFTIAGTGVVTTPSAHGYLQAGKTSCTFTAPSTITSSNNYSAGQAVFFYTSGTLPTGLTAGTVYYVISTGLTGSAFEVSATPGGAALTFVGSGTGSATQTPYADIVVWFQTQNNAAAPSAALPGGISPGQCYYVTPVGGQLTTTSFSISTTSAIGTSGANSAVLVNPTTDGVPVAFTGSPSGTALQMVARPTGNLQSNFSIVLSGGTGTGDLDQNWGTRIKPQFQGPAIVVGCGQHMYVRGLAIVGLTGGTGNYYKTGIPTYAIGIALSGDGGGIVRGWVDNCLVQGYCVCIESGYNQDGVCEEITINRCTLDGGIGWYIAQSQNDINRIIDASCNTTYGVIAAASGGCYVDGGDYSLGSGINNAFAITGVSSLTTTTGILGWSCTFSLTVTSPDTYLNFNCYTAFALWTITYGIVPVQLTSFNVSTGVAQFQIWAGWLNGHFSNTVNPGSGSHLQAALQACTTLYASELVTCFTGVALNVKHVWIENDTIPTAIMFSEATFGTSKNNIIEDIHLNAPLSGVWQGYEVIVSSFTIASPGVVNTLFPHGYGAGTTVQFSSSGVLPTGITQGVTYYVIAAGLTSTAFEISTTLGGSAINFSGSPTGQAIVMNGLTVILSAALRIGRSWPCFWNYNVDVQINMMNDGGGAFAPFDPVIIDILRSQQVGAYGGLAGDITWRGFPPALQLRVNGQYGNLLGIQLAYSPSLGFGQFEHAAFVPGAQYWDGSLQTTWRSVDVGQSPYLGYRPAPWSKPILTSSQVSTLAGSLPAISTSGSGIGTSYAVTYPLMWGSQIYGIDNSFNTGALTNYGVSSNHNGFTLGQDLTTSNISGLSWSYEAGSPCVYINRIQQYLLFPGLVIGLDNGGGNHWYMVTGRYSIGYITVMDLTAGATQCTVGTLGTTYTGSTIKQQVFALTLTQPAEALGSVAITDAATIATDCSKGNYFTVTLAGNRTLGAPTSMIDGVTYTWQITQDGSGSRTLAYNSIFTFAATDTHTLSTAAGSIDVLKATYNATAVKFRAALTKAYS